MTLRYRYNNQPIAEGERVMVLNQGRLYVRTGLKSVDPAAEEITYRLREVYDDAQINTPPVVSDQVGHGIYEV